MNYRELYKTAEETEEKIQLPHAPTIIGNAPTNLGGNAVYGYNPSRQDQAAPVPQPVVMTPTTAEERANPNSEFNQALRQHERDVIDSESGQAAGAKYDYSEVDFDNHSPVWKRKFLEKKREEAQAQREWAQLANNAADMGIVGIGALGRGAESVIQLPYNLLYHAGGKYLGLPPAGSFFEPAIEDAARDAVRNGVSPTAVELTRATAEAIPQAMAYYTGAGALSNLPGAIGPAAAATVRAEPFVTPAVQLGVEGGEAVLNSDRMRYWGPMIGMARIPQQMAEIAALKARGMSEEQATALVHSNRWTDMQRTAASLYPDNVEEQNKWLLDKLLSFASYGAPVSTVSTEDLMASGASPEEVTKAYAQGESVKENKKEAPGVGPIGSKVMSFVKGRMDPGYWGRMAAKNPETVVPTLVGYLKDKAQGKETSENFSPEMTAGFFRELGKDGKKFSTFITSVASGFAKDYDMEAMKPLIAKLQEMGKDINWEEFGLTKEQGARFAQALEDGFKNKAIAEWKQDPFGKTPLLIGLWLRNMGVDAAIADIVENPWAFYGGAFALLAGGGALVGGLLGGGEDEAPRMTQQPVVRSPYDGGYTQFAQARL